MKLGVDARKIRDGGIGTYIRNLLRIFLERPQAHSFVLFLLKKDLGSLVRFGSHAAEVEVSAGKYSIAEHWLLARAASRAGIDLYHAPHYTLPLPLRCPAVVTVHDLIHVRFARFFPAGAGIYARTIAGAAVRKARLVLVDSIHVSHDVMEFLGVPEERIRVVPLGVSGEFTRRPPSEVDPFLKERSLPAEYLLYVGARKQHKNLGLLIDALGKMPAKRRPPLVLSGVKWEAGDPLAARARAAGVLVCIHFSGPLQTDEDLALLYSGAALYVQPSLDEGFGLPPLEAMACGTPVVASSAGALPETLGSAAVLLPPNDSESWSETIPQVLGNSGRLEDLRKRGLKWARGFTWERTAGLTMKVYEEAMRGG